ncbi:c-type cytochrome [Roseibium porphyridii]|uniref:C-type cytochrome n=1 Tax=Roseibium porphyridii TaxID=2866279 RepID=A0ABY8F0W3_9HYPH|nr:c-type cytochrome [Roseibium sp. KMA01]WFE89065.1 c-type cytochrome [Roseibium sp. KMA01]
MSKSTAIIVSIGLLAQSLSFAPSGFAASGESAALRDISKIQVDERRLTEAVASRTLTWLTGNSANNDYISVGRLANFFGFVGLRVASRHSLKRSRIAQETLSVLNERQRAAMVSLVHDQMDALKEAQQARHEMNRALEGLLAFEPVTKERFIELGRDYGSHEAELGRVLAQTFGDIAQTLSTDQKQALTAIRVAHVSGEAQQGSGAGSLRLKKLSKADKKELVNVSARFLSWTTGSQEFNDFEVVGKPSQHFGFVALRIDSNHGVKRGAVAKQVMEMLTPSQIDRLRDAAQHNAREFPEFLTVRAQLMRVLETSLSGQRIDTARVAHLGAEIGEIEASMTWSQAMAMLDVRNGLSETQSAELLAMRAKYTAQTDAVSIEDPVERGRQLFAQCALCHKSSNQQSVGPSLDDVVGKPIASDPAFDRYSPALLKYAKAEGTWSEEQLDEFLRSPKNLVPGTVMGFDGYKMTEDRAALIAYLKSRK